MENVLNFNKGVELLCSKMLAEYDLETIDTVAMIDYILDNISPIDIFICSHIVKYEFVSKVYSKRTYSIAYMIEGHIGGNYITGSIPRWVLISCIINRLFPELAKMIVTVGQSLYGGGEVDAIYTMGNAWASKAGTSTIQFRINKLKELRDLIINIL